MKSVYKRIVGLIYLFIFMSEVIPLQAQTYYISSSSGDNRNDGLTEQTPKKDLTDIPKKNVTILFCKGDVFWGGLSGYTDCTISSYGRGERPVLCGFKVLINPNAWKEEGNGLWSLDLRNKDDFRGYVLQSEDETFNNIGYIYDAKNDKLYGRNVMRLDSLKHEMDFFTSSYFSKTDIKEHPFGKVIVKSDDNPARYGRLCFPMYERGGNLMTNCEINGLAIVGFSMMGLVRLKGCTVDDCQIDLIGGGIFVGYNSWCRYGNGIELWYQYNDNTIKNCIISRTYDCATTIQASGEIKTNPKNNHFVGNRFYKCRQAFEHFLNPSDGSLKQYENCDFTNNICYLMGENGFNSPEMRDCNILSYENKSKPILINNNIFFGANHLDGSGIDEGMDGNIVYLYQDQYLYTKHWLKEKATILGDSKASIAQYRNLVPDKSKVVILKRGSWKAKRIERNIKRKIDWKPVNLHLERLCQ